VIRDESGRTVIHCDRCKAQLDLGAAAIVAHHVRMPSGWIQHEVERHLCPVCAGQVIDETFPKDGVDEAEETT
jgi:hypothetical protein